MSTTLTTATSKTPSVNSDSALIAALRPVWAMVDALMGGTDAMRKASETYLPKWPKEEDEAYTDRLSKSTLFPAFKRTVVTLAARPFSKQGAWGPRLVVQAVELFDSRECGGPDKAVYHRLGRS